MKAIAVKDKKIISSKINELPGSFRALLELVKEMKDELAINDELGGIGFALAGILDKNREKMIKSPNIGFLDNQSVKKEFSEIAGAPVKIEHDVHCFLLAEKEAGCAKDFKNIFYITLGTGVGGALMIDSKIYFGSHGAAGEIGHTIIDFDTETELEEVSCNRFLQDACDKNSLQCLERARGGQEKAINAFRKLGANLGLAIANIINVVDPDAVILSGGIAEGKDFLLPSIQQEVLRFVLSKPAKETKILFSQLGRFGGALGAALLFEKD